jgi:hypothetical protein
MNKLVIEDEREQYHRYAAATSYAGRAPASSRRSARSSPPTARCGYSTKRRGSEQSEPT